jgi:ABC-type multidrug transport system ATPase subunit
MNPSAIELRDIWKFFGEFPAVRAVNLDIPANAIIALLGRNGAGKTTVLRMIAGLLRPSRGEVVIDGVPADPEKHAASIGMVGHGLWLYDDLTCRENLAFFARLYDVPSAPEKIDHWIREVGLWTFRDARVNQLSRGMRQRLTIARALLHSPAILLLDEPWTSLDDRAMDLLSSLLLRAQSENHTVLVSSHQLKETLQIATHLAVIDRGRLVFNGPNRDEFRQSPHELYQRIS